MRSDPIVAEVRAIRSELAARCGYDVEEIFRRSRERQVRSGLTYVRYPARRGHSVERHASARRGQAVMVIWPDP